MTLRSILFCRFAVVLSALLSLSASAFAKEKVFEEKIDSLFSKRIGFTLWGTDKLYAFAGILIQF